jgi:hypothetical protein
VVLVVAPFARQMVELVIDRRDGVGGMPARPRVETFIPFGAAYEIQLFGPDAPLEVRRRPRLARAGLAQNVSKEENYEAS